MAKICLVVSLSKNCRVIKKTVVAKFLVKISDLFKSWGPAPQDRMDIQIQSYVL